VALDAPDGTLAGYGVCRSAADEGEILNVAVAEAWRGRGAGHILVEAMLRHLAGRGAARVYLEVRASNAAAIGLYASLAFERVGIRRGYYARPREDAVVMAVTVASWRAEKR
jgi:ribosomal-protein-alanine N-acetyltransferase